MSTKTVINLRPYQIAASENVLRFMVVAEVEKDIKRKITNCGHSVSDVDTLCKQVVMELFNRTFNTNITSVSDVNTTREIVTQ